MIVKILGAPMITLLKQEDPTAYLDLFREFETVKRKIQTDTTGKVNFTKTNPMKMPSSFVSMMIIRFMGYEQDSIQTAIVFTHTYGVLCKRYT
jgi:hypothetical protein